MAGFNVDIPPTNVYNLLVDNIKVTEIKNDPKEAKNYGLDHLSRAST
jgi:hypothetical protein